MMMYMVTGTGNLQVNVDCKTTLGTYCSHS